MKKRILGLLLAIALVAPALNAAAPHAQAGLNATSFFGTNLTWSLDTSTGALAIGLRDGATSGSMPTTWGATSAPWYAYASAVRSATVAPGVANVGQYAFYGCVNMTGVSLPASVASIGQYAFSGCALLTGITLPTGIDYIGTGAFAGCLNLVNFSIGGAWSNARFLIDAGSGVLVEREPDTLRPIRVIKAPVGMGPGFSIPGTVTAIDPEAFAYSRLEAVEIPASVNNIGLNAFSWSVFLKEAVFLGNAPATLPSGSLGLFDYVAAGFRIYYYPYTLRWPTPPSTNWRGYTAVALTSYVLIDKTVAALEAGKTTQLNATVYPTNASQKVAWAVVDQSDPDPGVVIATVSPEGIVRAGLVPGWVDIRAVSTLPDGVTTVTSPPTRVYIVENVVAVASLTLDKTQITLNPGGAAQALAAIIYPLDATNKEIVWTSSNTNVAYVDIVPQILDPLDPLYVPGTLPTLGRLIVPVGPGTAVITATTVDGGRSATCVVTVTALPVFVPVTNLSLSTTTIAAGTLNNLNDLASVQPAGATRQLIQWKLLEQTTYGADLAGSILTVPFGQTGTVTVEATIRHGLAEIVSEGPDPIEWGYPENIDYVRVFTFNIVPFIPVTGITGLPTLAFAGVPLQLSGTVNPVGASSSLIEWEMVSNTAGAYLDANAGVLTAQWPGVSIMKAIVRNGRISGTDRDYEQQFTVRVEPYTTHALDIRANPGGYVFPPGVRQLASGEKIQLTATPSAGYIFAGWSSTNGGDFEDASRTVTDFTMPGNATTVTAYFAYTGLPAGSVGGGGGGVLLPAPVHYFTNNSVYFQNSGVVFGHVTLRDYQLFGYVTLDGRVLVRNSHYTALRVSGYTEIVLANGYLDSLPQGPHTLTVYFTDQVSVTAVFTVLLTSYASPYYSDVYVADWYSYGVAFVAERGWMVASPTDPERFRPSDPVTQGEVIEALYRMAGTPYIANTFGQPLQGRTAALEWVRSNGILPISGTYSLGDAISRQDIAVLFGRVVTVMRLRYPVVRSAPSFADEWQMAYAARAPVSDMYRAGIINGRTVSTFVPLGNMTRAEFAVLLQKFSEAVSSW